MIYLIPLILFLNFGAPLIALVWLLALGDWRTIVLGITFLVISNHLLALLALPQLLCTILIKDETEGGNPIAIALVGSLLNAITSVLYVAIATLVLYRPQDDTSPIPYAIICFVAATSIYTPERGGNNEYAFIPLVANYIAAFIAAIALILAHPNLLVPLSVYASIVMIGVPMNAIRVARRHSHLA